MKNAQTCGIIHCNAGVSELVDEIDSKSIIRKGVWVRVPPPVPKKINPVSVTLAGFMVINLTLKAYTMPFFSANMSSIATSKKHIF